MKAIYRSLGFVICASILSCTGSTNDAETSEKSIKVLNPLEEAKSIFSEITSKYDSVSVEDSDSTFTYYVIPKNEDYDHDKELYGAFSIEKSSIIQGDLNGDGLEDAVVKYSFTPHLDNNTLIYYKVLIQKNSKLEEISEIYGGGRCEGPILELKEIKKGIINFDGLDFASGDPCCCPTINKNYAYKIVDGKAVEVK